MVLKVREKNFLIISRNTGQMLLIEKTLRDAGISIELVPAPARQGMVCTRAVKINGDDLERVNLIFEQKKINVSEIAEEEKLKLKDLLESKLAGI